MPQPYWLPPLVGLALGLVPPRWLYPAGCRHLTLIELRFSRRNQTLGRRKHRWWKLPIFFLDPLRGYLTANLLYSGAATFPVESPLESTLVDLAHKLAVIVVLAMQMFAGRQKSGQVLAPLAFLLGFISGFKPSLAVVGAAVGLLALATMLTSRSFKWGYVAGGLAALCIGFPFLGVTPALAFFAFIASAPVLAALVVRGRLVMPVGA